MRLRPKLIVSYVLLGLSITLISLVGGRYIQHQSTMRTSYRSDLLVRTSEIATLANSASEEGFSFVLTGEPEEKKRSLGKLAAARGALGEMASDAELSAEERRLFAEAILALDGQVTAARALFDAYSNTGGMTRKSYDRYEDALDAHAAKLTALREQLRNQNVEDRTAAACQSSQLTLLIGFVSMLVAAAVGSALARNITKPVLILRDAAVAIGAGRTDAPFPPASSDEVGELTSAFQRMTEDGRSHVATIQKGQQLLEDVFATLEEIVIVCDDEGRIVTANPTCCRVAGRSLEEMHGQPAAAFFGKNAPGAHSSGQSFASREIDATMTIAEGREVPVRLTVQRFRGQSRHGWVCVAQNLTDRQRLEAELRQSQKMEGIGRLAGGIAHDFNNLLSVVLAYSEMLADGLDANDPMLHDLNDINQAGRRAADLTRQLLAFSRQQVLAPKVIDLNGVVTGMEKMLRRLLGEDVALTVATAQKVGRVKVDPGQMEQILMNLAVNARDAMPAGGRLTIETREVAIEGDQPGEYPGAAPGRYVLLAVTDSGTGIDAATQAHIFEPFFTTKAVGKGTGLGLSTVFGIVRQSGGHISVRSTMGEGTTFRVLIPVADPSHPITAAPAALAASDTLAGSETVLLVEDEEGVRRLVRTVLRRQGYTVLEAQNGGEALLICEQYAKPIDLVLTDVVMPHLNGPQLFDRLHPMRPDMQVLYMSGYIDHAFRDGEIEPGAAFLQKPITPGVLARRVRQVIDSGASLRS